MIKKDIVITSAIRTAVGSLGKSLKNIPGDSLGSEVISNSIKKSKIKTEDVDEVVLPPLQVEITPLLKSGDPAPPFEFSSIRGAKEIKSSGFDGEFVLLNFWTAAKVNVKADQLMVQEMYMELKEKYDLRLLSVNVDQEPKPAIDLIKTSKLAGPHGTTQGLEHPALFNYGVRSVPSFWLVTGDGKIAMTSLEITTRQQEGVELKSIISDRISGSDRLLVPDQKAP